MENEYIEIKINITDVANKCLRHIRNTTEVVGLIYHAIQNYDASKVPLLPVDALQIKIKDPEEKKSDISLKEQSLDWLFKKAFEEYIVGITESLIEAYKCLKYLALERETQSTPLSDEEIKKKIEDINKKGGKLYIPELVQAIEEELKLKLNFKDEILSINKVRNCFVHRNNIITDKDINNTTKNTLDLEFIELVVFVTQGEELIELKSEHKEKGIKTKTIVKSSRKKTISFKKGEHIKIDPTTFNNISYTCINFVHNLLAVMPILKQK